MYIREKENSLVSMCELGNRTRSTYEIFGEPDYGWWYSPI